LAHARRRPSDGGAQGGLALHLLDGPIAGRARGRRVLPREAPAEVHAPSERRHAALLPVVEGPNVRLITLSVHAARGTPAPTSPGTSFALTKRRPSRPAPRSPDFR